MSRVNASAELPHPAERVWRVATRVADMPRWMPEVVSAELLDPALAPGSRIRLRLGPATGNAEITGTVERLELGHLLEVAGSGGPLGVDVRVELEPHGADGTRVTLQIEITTPPFLGFIAREAERRILTELPGSLERLGALIEADAG